MAFSSIKKKTCKRFGCDKYPKIGYAGYCGKSCMPEEMQNLEKYRKGAVSYRTAASLSKLSKKVHTAQNDVLEPENALKQSELQQWFANIERIIARNPYCMECKTYIPSAYYHHATAHIFPKSIFESVATHPMNYLILGAGCGCHDKTHRLDTFSDMKCWTEAVRRFRLFEKSITEKHKYLNAFREYADGNQ